MEEKEIIVGIDATNIRGGGGVTHLLELLQAATPTAYGIKKIIVWGGEQTLALIPEKPWLKKISPKALNGNLISRTCWQYFKLTNAVKKMSCTVLLVPGGSFTTSFRPVVTICQNMLPFEWTEIKRYGYSTFACKLLLLRLTQSRSFKKASALIFLSQYAKKNIEKLLPSLPKDSALIPLGINSRFFSPPRKQKDISHYNTKNPFRILYVSTIDLYKHQWHVIDAISILRKEGYPVILDLIGSATPHAFNLMNKSISSSDPEHQFIYYHGAVSFDKLHHYYLKADLGLFASSCENLPNILLEMMASGLPVASSNRGPMPEVLSDGGIYFNPEQPAEIVQALRTLIDSSEKRTQNTEKNFKNAQKYSWKICANDTFQLLATFSKKNTS